MNRSLKRKIATLLLCMSAIVVMAQDAPVNSLPIKTINGRQYHYYTIQPKETIYSISHKLGIDKQTIEQHNPSVKDGMRGTGVLYFPIESATPQTSPATLPANITHKAKKGESAYAIAHMYGVSVADLVAANPRILDGVKANDMITIPAPGETTHREERNAMQHSTSVVQPETQEAYVTDGRETEPQAEPADSTAMETEPEATPQAIDIAVLLPFQTDRDKPSKQAQHYTDFLKGLLMAADTMRHAGTPIHLTVFDTHDSADTVRAVIGSPEIAGTDIVIAPDDSAHIDIISQWADTAGARVLNMFAVRNTAHEIHPSLIQGNILHEMMYEKAVRNFMKRFDGYTPVIVNNMEEDADKSKFTDMLVNGLTSAGTEYRAIAHNGKLDESQLAWMAPDKRYVFVPTSSSRVVLNSILPAITTKKQEADDAGNVALFGYPEWIIIRGDLLQKLHEAGTTIYSRFVMNPDNYRSRTLESRFRECYGTAMIPTAPMYGTLGFDTGMWIINAAMDPEKAACYTGIQNGFNLIRKAPDQGYVNNSLFLIDFMPNGLIESSNCD